MNYPFRRAPAIGNVPTIRDGAPPHPDLQERVVENQVRTASRWDDTAVDMTVADMVNAEDNVRQTRQQIVVVALICLLVFMLGSWWTYNNYLHDRLFAQEKARAAQTPYVPEVPVR